MGTLGKSIRRCASNNFRLRRCGVEDFRIRVCDCCAGCLGPTPRRYLVVTSGIELCTQCKAMPGGTHKFELLSGDVNGAFVLSWNTSLPCSTSDVPIGCHWSTRYYPTYPGTPLARCRRYRYQYSGNCTGVYATFDFDLHAELTIGEPGVGGDDWKLLLTGWAAEVNCGVFAHQEVPPPNNQYRCSQEWVPWPNESDCADDFTFGQVGQATVAPHGI